VSLSLFHYTSVGYFFSGRLSKSRFFVRKARIFRNLSHFAIFDVMSVFIKKVTKFTSVSPRFRDDSILRDVLFESQDFRHSFMFEIVWAVFPTIIILSILVPSLYLLYSLDEDLDPRYTIKVIGNQ
jgi:heme/copper-type cytochrome/quinol oxidase subunit 2